MSWNTRARGYIFQAIYPPRLTLLNTGPLSPAGCEVDGAAGEELGRLDRLGADRESAQEHGRRDSRQGQGRTERRDQDGAVIEAASGQPGETLRGGAR